MQTIYLLQPGSVLRATSTHFHLGERRQIAIAPVGQIILGDRCDLSRSARQIARSRRIPVLYLGDGATVLGRATWDINPSPQSTQLQRRHQRECRLKTARSLLRAKLSNSQTLLSHLDGDRPIVRHAIDTLSTLWEHLPLATNLTALQRNRAFAETVYWQALQAIRPEICRASVYVNLGYALLSHRLYGAIARSQLHPELGNLHLDCPNYTALACDLMEPLRALVVDAWAIAWVNPLAGSTVASNGSHPDPLPPRSLQLTVQHWEQWLQASATHPQAGTLPLGEYLEWQVRAYRAYLWGETLDYCSLLLHLPPVPKAIAPWQEVSPCCI
jgi:CRISPR-associated protein Cas1